MTYVFLKYTRCLIVISCLLTGQELFAQTHQTKIGKEISNIRFAAYDPFAKGNETETGNKTSCISAVIYGLRKIGLNCPYKDFKTYYGIFLKQASILELGKTKFNKKGLILFNRDHFVALFADKNKNGVVDVDDQIIHAYFLPLDITSISEWLNKDPVRPIYYIDLDKDIQCPK